ncbi:MAG: organic solvent tolerance ABC transporter substrate-binding protein [Candidatus Rokuibacteriota bacterium]|nr:MAG: organic solvent tolerance ABC transporter substrate-binding protein [Candidatus Rokubacteria bacterium]
MVRVHETSTFRSWGYRVAIARIGSIRPRDLRVPLFLVTVSVLCLFWIKAWAGVPTDQLRGSVDRVIQILEDPQLKAEARATDRRAAIRKEAESIFDFTETAKRALGQHWKTLNTSQQQEFVSLFEDLLERAYVLKIEKYSGEKVTYLGDTVDGDLATVKTKFTTKQGTEIPVDYRLLRRGDRWLVYDVFVEGVSLVANYRTQFDRIMRTGSYDELVRRMKASQSDFNSAPGKSPTPRS